MKTKVRNAEGKVLDYLVAKAKGCEIYHDKLLNDFWISENPPHHRRTSFVEAFRYVEFPKLMG